MSCSSHYFPELRHSQLKRGSSLASITHSSVFSILQMFSSLVGFFQSHAHSVTFTLIVTVLGKAARLHTARLLSYALRHCTKCRKRADPMEVATLVLLYSPQATGSKDRTSSRNGAQNA